MYILVQLNIKFSWCAKFIPSRTNKICKVCKKLNAQNIFVRKINVIKVCKLNISDGKKMQNLFKKSLNLQWGGVVGERKMSEASSCYFDHRVSELSEFECLL